MSEARQCCRRDLETAIEESIKLQSHYANLLNMHDGGKRIRFSSASEWIMRLRETGTLSNSARQLIPAEDALRKIKLECLTNDNAAVALMRIVRLCLDAGITENLQELQSK